MRTNRELAEALLKVKEIPDKEDQIRFVKLIFNKQGNQLNPKALRNPEKPPTNL